MSTPDAEWTKDYLKPLVGAKVAFVSATPDGFPIIHMLKGDEHYKLEISQDEEGNGPGFIFGLPHPK